MDTVKEAQRGQSANRSQHQGRSPHYWLRAIGVEPIHQGVLDMADEKGVGCFLTTAIESKVAWYERFGFAVVATYRPTHSWQDVWAMWREPSVGPL